MKKSKIFRLLPLLLGLFFLLQFGAELFFSFSKGASPEKVLSHLQKSMRLSPLTAVYPSEAGFLLMEKGTRDNDPGTIKTSISFFRIALKKNPLDYRSRYYLAKAYLRFSAPDNDYFELGVGELKRAARLRGSNRLIALECSKIFFSLWPLLEEEDQVFARNLLTGAVPALAWPQFSSLVEMWALYVQDTPLLMDLLKQKPEFFGPTANQLVAAGIPIADRHLMLDLHEIHTQEAMQRRFSEWSLAGNISLDNARTLLDQLLNIKGYHRLHPGSMFSQDSFNKLQRTLLLRVLSGLLTDSRAKADLSTAAQLNTLIQAYIASHSGLTELDELQKLLADHGYFKENDFPSLRLKTLIAYNKSDYAGVISDIEALRKSISFIKKEQESDYTEILLMLIDSLYSSKLLTSAETIAQELYLEHPDNPDVLWRVLRVQKIMGSEGAPDPQLQGRLAAIENSRFLTVAKPGMVDVFLFNQPQVEIAFDPAWLATLKPKQLLQVFVDGKIAFESYVDGMPGKIVIGPPFVEIESKVRVQVTIL